MVKDVFKILTLNNISTQGLARFPRDRYELATETLYPDAVLLRSFQMHDMVFPATLKAVGRAGAGVNNIPVEKLSKLGIPVFNAPGANANAVKELVIAGMLLACRNICNAWRFSTALTGDDAAIHQQVENGKKQFVGIELPGRTLGVIGLGAIGRLVANAALDLGMNVIGYDPGLTVQGAWKLSSKVEQARGVEDLVARSDFISLHVPLRENTQHLINTDILRRMKQGAVVLNFAREGIVDEDAVVAAIHEQKLRAYVCDFPSNKMQNHANIIALPHLGASTLEAEDNCAIMVADALRDYLENGNIKNSVNFPEVDMARCEAFRISIVNANVPNMVGQISTALAKAGLNICDMLNKSKGEIAYTVVDLDSTVPAVVIQEIGRIAGVLAVRAI